MTPQDQTNPRWPLERVLFAVAGTVTLVAVALGGFVSRWFLLLGALVGVSEWLFVTVGACPTSIVLARVFGLRSAVYPDADAPSGSAPSESLRERVVV